MAPQTDPKQIREILTNDRFNPEILSQLEAYVGQQIDNNTYDLEANLAVLKLYQFTNNVDVTVVANILVKALTALPNADFTKCLYLIPEATQQQELIAGLVQMAETLEMCRFKDFWAQAKAWKGPKALSDVPGFFDGIRQFIVGTIGITFQNISMDILTAALQLDMAATEKFVTSVGWKLSGKMAEIPLNKDNQEKPVKSTDGLQMEQMTRLLTSLSGGR